VQRLEGWAGDANDVAPARVVLRGALGRIYRIVGRAGASLSLPQPLVYGSEATMNVQTNLRMGKPAFLAWLQEREGRYELDVGHVVMMTGGTRRHGRILRRLAVALERRIDAGQWEIWTSDFGVDLGPKTVRYPDVVIDTVGGGDKDLTAASPVLIAEVTSPSSATDDLGEKAAQYLRLGSLAAYLVLAQDDAKAWVWVRGTSGFPASPEVVDANEVILISALGIDLPLAEIYGSSEQS
jgi:Uma2 family endonuclease